MMYFLCVLSMSAQIADLTEQLQARIASQSDLHQRTLELQQALEDKELSAHDLKVHSPPKHTPTNTHFHFQDMQPTPVTFSYTPPPTCIDFMPCSLTWFQATFTYVFYRLVLPIHMKWSTTSHNSEVL